MKSIITLVLGGLLTTSAFASNITLNFSGSRNYQVMIDGRNVTSGDDRNRSTIYLNELRPGQHTLEVYRTRKSRGWGWGWGDQNRGAIYSSYFNVSPELDLAINIDDGGRVQMDESRSADFDRTPGDRHDRDGHNDGWKGYGKQDRDDEGRNGSYEHGDNGYDNRGGWNGNGYVHAMNEGEFSQLLQRIRGQWTDNMIAARNAVNANYFTTLQVRQLLQAFPSERDRQELAELSYTKVVDQQNFRRLYDLFSMQSQSELDYYIRNTRQ